VDVEKSRYQMNLIKGTAASGGKIEPDVFWFKGQISSQHPDKKGGKLTLCREGEKGRLFLRSQCNLETDSIF